MTVSPEKIAEMLAAAEKATPGKRRITEFNGVPNAIMTPHPDFGGMAICTLAVHHDIHGNAELLKLTDPDTIREILTELTTLRSQLSGITDETSSWQPIETAPKDGTTVDLYGARGATPRRFPDARWMEIHMMGTGDPTGEYRWFFPAWDMYGEFEFTHWRDVPPNPEPTHDQS